MDQTDIKKIIKEKVLIERLELEDITPDEIIDSEPLFIDGLGLDSVEALGVKVPKMMNEETQRYFHSVDSLAEYISTLLN